MTKRIMAATLSLPLRTVFAIAFVVATATTASALARQAVPVDEAQSSPHFLAFRERLIEAVEDRDVAFLVSHATEDIKLGFGGDDGRAAFEDKLTLSKDDLAPEYADHVDTIREEYWHALETVLRMGGRFETNERFIAPYTTGVDIGPDADAFTTWFVIADDVPLRTHASPRSEVITMLAYDIVTAEAPEPGAEFVEIHTDDGKTGYVEASHLWSAVGYRASFELVDGEWMITSFLAGD
jgi:hypothetical protein